MRSQKESKGVKRRQEELRLDKIRLISLKLTKGKPKGIKES